MVLPIHKNRNQHSPGGLVLKWFFVKGTEHERCDVGCRNALLVLYHRVGCCATSFRRCRPKNICGALANVREGFCLLASASSPCLNAGWTVEIPLIPQHCCNYYCRVLQNPWVGRNIYRKRTSSEFCMLDLALRGSACGGETLGAVGHSLVSFLRENSCQLWLSTFRRRVA